jgi:pimeloyl-ACP methyl ester carboxylesterase
MATLHTTRSGIVYDVVGDGHPAIVLIHGYPLDRSVWAEVVPLLADRATVLSVDLPGFGASAPPLDGDLSMARLAGDVADVLDAEGIDAAVIVGLSMGGYVALAFAELHPGRVRALALVGAKTEPDGTEAKAARDAQSASILAEGRTTVVGPLLGALLAPDATMQERARLRTMIEATPYETFVGALAGMRDRPDRTDVVRSLAVPVVVIVGDHDPLVPVAMAREIADMAADGSLTVIEGEGHLVPMEAPAAVAAALLPLLAP